MSEQTVTTTVLPTVEVSGTNVPPLEVPRVGLGTWPMIENECTDAVLAAIDSGYRHIDTAENYRNEDAVGQALRQTSVSPEEIFVTTKVNAGAHGGVNVVREAVEKRMRALGRERLDLVLIHWPNPDQDRYLETAEALATLAGRQLIRAWGVSNFKPHHLARLTQEGLVPAVNQIQLDPEVQQPDAEAANTASGTLTAAYSPIGRGLDLLRYPELTDSAKRHGRTVHQIVLRWHLQKGRIVVPKSANRQRQQENLALFDFQLSEAEMSAIDRLGTGAGPRLDSDEFGH